MRFYFAKPPKVAIACYLMGFLGIGVAMTHQWASYTWWSIVANQQLFIASALIVAVGSALNWLIPLICKQQSDSD